MEERALARGDVDARLAFGGLMSRGDDDDASWLAAFHAGDRSVLEQCYRDHFGAITTCVGRYLRGVDAETVTHEVFYRLLSEPEMRRSFVGGNLGAWLKQIATRAAIDHLRRARREVAEIDGGEAEGTSVEDELDAKILIRRFREQHLPEQWQGVFDTRFLRQLPQRDAARELGIHRTTLVYQELRIRALLEKFLLGRGPS